jgi:hypothetical protein
MAMIRFISIAVVCTLLLIPIAGFSSNIISNGPLLIAFTFTLGYVALPALLLRLWPEPQGQKEKSMQDALCDGDLVMAEHVVRDAAQIEELEDEGLHFLLATGTGQTLCLSGQYLYGPVERKSFPSTAVRIYKNRKSGVTYGIETLGSRIDQWQTYDPFRLEQVGSDMMIEDGKLYSESIAELVAKLGLHPLDSKAI